MRMVLLLPSAKLRRCSVRIVFLILLNTIMISCSAKVRPPLPATPLFIITSSVSPSPKIPVAVTVFTSPTLTNKPPSIASANEIIATGSIHSLLVNSITQEADTNAMITIDDSYIYLVGVGGPRDDFLFRIPIDGEKPQKIAVSKYTGGRLDLFQPLVSGNWIIFGDTPGNDPSKWMIRVVNLKDLSERLIIEEKNDTLNLAERFNFAAEGDNLYWTMLVPQSDQQYEDTISMMDLDTGKTVILTSTKVNGWNWSLLGVSEGRLVVEQDGNQNQGGGTNIFLFDPAGGQPQALSTDGASNMPVFAFPWVAWKSGPRYQWMKDIQIRNLQDSQTQSITLPGLEDSDPQMDGTRIYWSGATEDTYSYFAIYILDLMKNTIYVYPSSEKQVLFSGIAIHGGVIAWIRWVSPSTGKPYCYLEWTAIK